MNLRFGLIAGLFFVVSTIGFAKDSNLERGGLGFLYPDHNSMVNPGQFATSHGFAAQAEYMTDTKNSQGQTGDANVVYGNGMIGLGAGASRFAPKVTDSTNAIDTVKAGAGVSLIKERLTIGGSYSRAVSPLLSGMSIAEGTVTFQRPNRRGPSIGAGYIKTMNVPTGFTAASSSVIAGLGYSFRSNQSVEANVLFNDTSNWKDYNAELFFNTASNAIYFGGGWVYHALAVQHEVKGRIGFVLGSRFDISAEGGYLFVSGNAITYGATARFAF